MGFNIIGFVSLPLLQYQRITGAESVLVGTDGLQNGCGCQDVAGGLGAAVVLALLRDPPGARAGSAVLVVGHGAGDSGARSRALCPSVPLRERARC